MQRTNNDRCKSTSGFSLVEIMVALGVGMIVIGSAMLLFSTASKMSFTVSQRVEMQQNTRAAINNITYDLRTAGTAMPQGGIPLPSGAGISNTSFACSTAPCTPPSAAGNGYVNTNTFPGQMFYSLVPNTASGITITGRPSDSVTM